MYGWARYMTSLQQVILYFTICLSSGWVTHSPLMNVRAAPSSLAVVHFGRLTLKEADVCLETVGESRLDGKEVVVVLLELLA